MLRLIRLSHFVQALQILADVHADGDINDELVQLEVRAPHKDPPNAPMFDRAVSVSRDQESGQCRRCKSLVFVPPVH